MGNRGKNKKKKQKICVICVICGFHFSHVSGRGCGIVRKSRDRPKAQKIDYSVIEKNMVRAPDLDAAEEMFKKIDEVISLEYGKFVHVDSRYLPKRTGDSLTNNINKF